MLLLLSDDAMGEHRPGAGHVERPERLRTLLSYLRQRALSITMPPEVAREDLARVHTSAYLDQLAALEGRSAVLDPDTATSPGSLRAARLAAGAAVAAVDAVLDRRAETAFAAVRPPGHHAEADRAMGFCLYNNVAVAAAHAAARDDVDRVLIVDWDVHHGNGTQHVFEDRDDVLFFSTHRWPFYPGTGAVAERGTGAGAGFTLNVPLPGGVGDGVYAAVFDEILRPAAERFRPDLVLVSAGFDAHRRDPLGGMSVSAEGFAVLCERVMSLGPTVLVLEGGYDLEGLVESTDACVRVLSGEAPPASARPTDREWNQVVRPLRDALR